MFHLRDGFFFERRANGDVFIAYAPADAKAPVGSVTVPENEWASVLASVCARGENAATHQEARVYHGRDALKAGEFSLTPNAVSELGRAAGFHHGGPVQAPSIHVQIDRYEGLAAQVFEALRRRARILRRHQ